MCVCDSIQCEHNLVRMGTENHIHTLRCFIILFETKNLDSATI